MGRRIFSRSGTSGYFALLKPLDPDQKSRRPVALSRPVCVVGDRSRVHLPLPSPLISKSHALIVRDGNRLYVRDLASQNRVFVNGEEVCEAALSPADRLRIGPFTFLYVPGADLAKPAPAAEPANRPPPAQLILDGKVVLDLKAGKRRSFVIGTRPRCDVRVPNTGVAAVHAVVFQRSGGRFIRDLSSPAGTHVNGRMIREVELRGGEEIRIGTAIFRYELLPAEEAPPDTTAEASTEAAPPTVKGKTPSKTFLAGAPEPQDPWRDGPAAELSVDGSVASLLEASALDASLLGVSGSFMLTTDGLVTGPPASAARPTTPDTQEQATEDELFADISPPAKPVRFPSRSNGTPASSPASEPSRMSRLGLTGTSSSARTGDDPAPAAYEALDASASFVAASFSNLPLLDEPESPSVPTKIPPPPPADVVRVVRLEDSPPGGSGPPGAAPSPAVDVSVWVQCPCCNFHFRVEGRPGQGA